MRETRVRSLGRENPLEKEMANHSSTLAWKIPWREEPGRLQSMGSQRVGHDWATSQFQDSLFYRHPIVLRILFCFFNLWSLCFSILEVSIFFFLISNSSFWFLLWIYISLHTLPICSCMLSTLSITSLAYTSSVQSLSRVWLCDPMNCSTPGLPVHHQLPEFTQTHVHRVGDAIQPSHPLPSPFPPAPNPSQHQSLFQWVNSLHEVAKVLEFQV